MKKWGLVILALGIIVFITGLLIAYRINFEISTAVLVGGVVLIFIGSIVITRGFLRQKLMAEEGIPEKGKYSKIAITGFILAVILAILSIILNNFPPNSPYSPTAFLLVFNFLLSIIATYFNDYGLKICKKHGSKGKVFATLGLIISSFAFGLYLLIVGFYTFTLIAVYMRWWF